MKRIGQVIETTMAALAFTDSGEFETALTIIDKGPRLNVDCFLGRVEQDRFPSRSPGPAVSEQPLLKHKRTFRHSSIDMKQRCFGIDQSSSRIS